MRKKHRKNPWDKEEESLSGQEDQGAGQEDLNEYIRVASPGTFAVILSLLFLLVSTIIWGVTGTLPVTETVSGLIVDTSQYNLIYPVKKEETEPVPKEDEGEILVLCFVDASRFNGQAILEFGDQATLKMPDQSTFTGTIKTRFKKPISREEAKNILFDNEWVLEKCVSQDYNWLLEISPDEDLSRYSFTLAEVTLLTEEVAPIRFLMRQAGG